MQSKQIEASDREQSVVEVTINWRLSFEPGAEPEWAVCRLDDEGNEIAGTEVRFANPGRGAELHDGGDAPLMSAEIDVNDRTYAPTVPAQLRDGPSGSYVEGCLDGMIDRLAGEKDAIEKALDAFVKARQAWKESRP